MTMTPERLAELDAVMTRATEGPWQRKSGFEKLTIIGNIDGEIVESQTKYTYEMVCEVYDDNGVIVAGRNVTAIVALHNALPTIIAALETVALIRDEDWLEERISDSLDMDWRPIDAARAIIAALPKDEV